MKINENHYVLYEHNLTSIQRSFFCQTITALQSTTWYMRFGYSFVNQSDESLSVRWIFSSLTKYFYPM